jgi:lysophospholipase L1-like esterase
MNYNTMALKLATLCLLPVLIPQAKKVKANTPRLSEPEGQRQGVEGQGKPLSILIVGDSAAAGVGVEQQQQALLGQLIFALKAHYKIRFHLEAKTGRTTEDLIRVIKRLPLQSFDVVISSIGVNDVTRLTPPAKWLKQQKDLYSVLQNKFNPHLILVASVPPMHLFPALPQPMAWLLGKYAKEMNQLLQAYIRTYQNFIYLDYDLEKYQTMNLTMAKDGFHPSADIYHFWAQSMAQHIQNKF